jgi:hypothetical protein
MSTPNLYIRDHVVELVVVDVDPLTGAETPATGIIGGKTRYALTETGAQVTEADLVETATPGTYHATFLGAAMDADLTAVATGSDLWRVSVLSLSHPPITKKFKLRRSISEDELT